MESLKNEVQEQYEVGIVEFVYIYIYIIPNIIYLLVWKASKMKFKNNMKLAYIYIYIIPNIISVNIFLVWKASKMKFKNNMKLALSSLLIYIYTYISESLKNEVQQQYEDQFFFFFKFSFTGSQDILLRK